MNACNHPLTGGNGGGDGCSIIGYNGCTGCDSGCGGGSVGCSLEMFCQLIWCDWLPTASVLYSAVY